MRGFRGASTQPATITSGSEIENSLGLPFLVQVSGDAWRPYSRWGSDEGLDREVAPAISVVVSRFQRKRASRRAPPGSRPDRPPRSPSDAVIFQRHCAASRAHRCRSWRSTKPPRATCTPGLADRRAWKGIEIHHHEIDWLDLVLAAPAASCSLLAQIEEAAVHCGVGCFHERSRTLQGTREERESRDHFDFSRATVGGTAAGGSDLDACFIGSAAPTRSRRRLSETEMSARWFSHERFALHENGRRTSVHHESKSERLSLSTRRNSGDSGRQGSPASSARAGPRATRGSHRIQMHCPVIHDVVLAAGKSAPDISQRGMRKTRSCDRVKALGRFHLARRRAGPGPSGPDKTTKSGQRQNDSRRSGASRQIASGRLEEEEDQPPQGRASFRRESFHKRCSRARSGARQAPIAGNLPLRPAIFDDRRWSRKTAVKA